MDRAGGSADAGSTHSAAANDAAAASALFADATDAAAAAREFELDYAGFSRFELELEVCFWLILLVCGSMDHFPSACATQSSITNTTQFVQCLANPLYMQHLAILRRRSVTRKHEIMALPKRLEQLTNMVSFWKRWSTIIELSITTPTVDELDRKAQFSIQRRASQVTPSRRTKTTPDCFCSARS